MAAIKRLLVGSPIATVEEGHQRLVKVIALAVFASDAISSTAYAGQEILLVLLPASLVYTDAINKLIPISIVVVILLAIVVTSYRQTIYAYPNGGGGAYIVSRENLGEIPSLVVGASLLVDYILTVAVSVSAGVDAIISANNGWAPYRVPMCVGCVLLMMLANLRGVKESGRIFAGPTYVYLLALSILIGWGLIQSYTGHLPPITGQQEAFQALQNDAAKGIGLFLLLRAFSSGAIALSGVEAISNGVPAFKKPESHNAATTLVWMGVILGTFFFGISLLAHRLQPIPTENATLLSVMGEAVFGGQNNFLYILLTISTFAILILAANTAFADFPRLSSIVARDGYLPRQLANRGDRLVFSNGVLVLSTAAIVLILAFEGRTSLLIHLYAVGVFTGFTLSQAGMVRHHRKLQEPGWKRNMFINGLGSFATCVVLIIVVVSKFAVGAWIPCVLIPLIVWLFKGIHRHYLRVAEALRVPAGWKPVRHTHTVVVLVGTVHRGVLSALTYAKSLAPDRLIALSVVATDEEAEHMQEQWDRFGIDVTLKLEHSPYRELTRPVLAYLDELDAENDNDIITVMLPEFVLTHWWEHLLHNQSALLLKARLLFRHNTVVMSIPYHISGDRVDSPLVADVGGPAPDAARSGAAPSGDGKSDAKDTTPTR